MPRTAVLSPTAPGRMGERLDPAVVQTYLADLSEWVLARREELDQLDQAALASERRAELTGDLTLSMALWKAVQDRHDLLMATWDGGRVGPAERERLSVLIWGRLDASLDPVALDAAGHGAAGALAVSLPEACRLSDALAGQLRVRLALDPAADENARRIKTLRAQLDRLRDQVALEPSATRGAAARQRDEIERRTTDLVERFDRGGDVGGLIGPLENDAARLERDLIVGGVKRRELVDDVRDVTERRAALAARGKAVEALATRAVAAVDPCPNYAVPDVEALGPVPTVAGDLAAYRTRLDRVSRAMDMAQEAYGVALHEHDDLRAALETSRTMASASGVSAMPDVISADRLATDVLDRSPSPSQVARVAVDLHRAWVAWWSSPSGERTARRLGLGKDTP